MPFDKVDCVTRVRSNNLPSIDEQLSNSKKIPSQLGHTLIDTLAPIEPIENKRRIDNATSSNSKDSISKIDHYCSVWDWIWSLFGSSAPEAPKEMSPDEAREVKEFIDSINQLIVILQQGREIEAKEQNEEEEQFQGDKAINLLLEMQIASREKEFYIAKQQLDRFLKMTRTLSKERMEKIEERFNAAKSQKIWRLFEDLTVSFGLGAAAISLGVTNPALGAFLFYFALGLTVDRYFDDFTKRKIAESISGGNVETAENYTQYIKLGVGVACVAATIGAGGLGALSPLFTITSGTIKLNKALVERKANLIEADNIELSEKIKAQNSGREGTLKWVGEFTEAIRKHRKSIIDNRKNIHELTIAISSPA